MKRELIHQDIETQQIEPETNSIETGQWYWYLEEVPDDNWLGCITHIGSNYVKIEHPDGTNARVHLDQFEDRLDYEPNHQDILQDKIQHSRGEVKRLMGEVKALTARLGVSPRTGLPEPGKKSYTLMKLSGTNPQDYKGALIKAKEKDLPELFKKIERANESLAMWMKAEMLPLKAQANGMRACIGEIEGRIFNVSLYAGLTEQVVQVREGEPAGYDEKLCLMQRRCYMDEECLLDYSHGGMDFKDIKAFDRWISKPKNMGRILPFSRCMVAMRVRRKKKNRYAADILKAFVNIQLDELDQLTFLYIRNGEQLYRMNCDLEFGEMIFPDKEEFNPGEPMMFKRSFNEIKQLITRNDYDVRVQEHRERVRGDKAWRQENPIKKWAAANKPTNSAGEFLTGSTLEYQWNKANPYCNSHWGGHYQDDPEKVWEFFGPASVYYDEVVKDISDRIKHYNRIALIIQGLYDRSPVLHPHPPVKTWTPEGFEAAIKLIYDGDHALYGGERPSFEKYAASLRESIETGSVFVGQELAWIQREQEKEEHRRGRSRYYSYEECDVHTWWRPLDSSGPGLVATCCAIEKRCRRAKFRWHRERQRGAWVKNQWKEVGDPVITTISVDLDQLFHVSAYTPGDYLQFFQDPRTRADYMQWAPCLLAAEDYHAGKLEAQEPV